MYLLDANVFIQAKNLHYGFDFCPAFWDWLGEEHAAAKVHSVEKVFDEIKAGDDELSEWARARPEFFLNPDAEVVPSLQTVSNWAAGEDYESAAVNTFLQGGDYYLIAHAHAHSLTVVTHEIPANSTKRIKIPNAYGETAAIALHLHGDPPGRFLRVLAPAESRFRRTKPRPG